MTKFEQLEAGLVAIRDRHVKTGPYNQDGTTCTMCLLCGAKVSKGEAHEDERFSCAQAAKVLASWA